MKRAIMLKVIWIISTAASLSLEQHAEITVICLSAILLIDMSVILSYMDYGGRP
jgi:hypothetical protein